VPCCSVKKDSSNEYLETLRKEFDEVKVEKLEKFQLLTLRDKANQEGYDWAVWLELKIAYADTNSCNKTSQEKLEGCLEELCNWLPNLKQATISKPKQLSLFGDEEEIVLEKEPEYPRCTQEKSLAKYYREFKRARKNNMLKKYTFFELFRDVEEWWTYYDTDFSNMLPKSDEEMIDVVKEYFSGDIKSHLLFATKPLEDRYQLLTSGQALSDAELYNRILRLLCIPIAPYTQYKHVSTDLSFTEFIHEEQTGHYFLLNGSKITRVGFDNREYPTYNLRNAAFLQWVRDFFKIPFREPFSDEYILKENIKHYFRSMLYGKFEEYNLKKSINRAKTWKDFKKDLLSFCKKNGLSISNGGGSGYSCDTLWGSYHLWNKGEIIITQKVEDRLLLGRDVDSLERKYEDSDDVVVYFLQGDEIYKKAYELFHADEIKSLLRLS
jgi:hypothetical protein